MAYAIGIAHPLSVNCEMFGTGKVLDEKIASLIEEHFDPRSGAIIRDLGLSEEADLFADGDEWHFGRDDLDLPWERIVGGETNVAG